MNKKIIEINKLQEKLIPKRGKIALAHGVFDLFHIGHLKHLREAKKFGTLLIVSLTRDKFVMKGPDRPYYNENRILCMSQYLFKVQEKNRLKQHGLLKRFSIDCYGRQATLESIRKEKTELYKKFKIINNNIRIIIIIMSCRI